MCVILFTVITTLLVVYYLRRISNLKTEIAHVQYISDPSKGGWSNEHNFDNPVYDLESNSESRLLNNFSQKFNNLNRGTCSSVSSIVGSEVYNEEFHTNSDKGLFYIIYILNISICVLYQLYIAGTLAKNLDADLTNPRMYNTLDGLKEEHVYDEIKHKDCSKDPGTFNK